MAQLAAATQNVLKNLGMEGVKIRSVGKTSVPSLQSPEVLAAMRNHGAYKYIRYFPKTDTFKVSTVFANQVANKILKQAALGDSLPESEYLRLQVEQRVAGNSEAFNKYLDRAYGGMLSTVSAEQAQIFRQNFINATINPRTYSTNNQVRALLQAEIAASETFRKEKHDTKEEEDKRNPFSFEVLNHMVEICSEKSLKGDARVEYFFGEVYPIVMHDSRNTKIELEPKVYTKSRPQTSRRGGRGKSANTLELLLRESADTIIDITSMLKDGTKVRKSTQAVSSENSMKLEYTVGGLKRVNTIKFGKKADKRESVRAVLTEYRQKFDLDNDVGRAIDSVLEVLTRGSSGQQQVFQDVSAGRYFQ